MWKDTTSFTWKDTTSFTWWEPGFIITAEPGIVTFSGFANVLPPDSVITAEPGIVTFSGFANVNIIITAEPGIVTFSGFAGLIQPAVVVFSQPGIVTFSGTASIILPAFKFTAEPGIVTFSGVAGPVNLISLDDAQLSYIFTLTGSPDIEIPFTSFQARMRSGASTYMSVVVPGVHLSGEIADRSDGDMRVDAVFYSGGTQVRQTIILVHLDTIRIDKGPVNQAITLTGYRQETYAAKSVNMTGETYMNLTDGRLLYRFGKPNLTLNPGDTVTVGDDTFTADMISFYVNAQTGTQMEVSEQ